VNISLKKISQLHNLSVRTYNVCSYNQLNDLNSILLCFNKNSNFLHLLRIGKKTNEELTSLCNYYQVKNIQNIQINELVFIENLDKNSINFLVNNDIHDLNEMIKFINNYSGFIPNEIEKIYTRFCYINNTERSESKIQKFRKITSSEIVSIIENRRKILSVRAYHSMIQIIREVNVSPETILKYENKKYILNLKNVGKKTLTELTDSLKEIISIVKKIEHGESEVLDARMFQLENRLNLKPTSISRWLKDNNLTIDSYLPLLSFALFYIDTKVKKRNLDIVVTYYNDNDQNSKNLKAIASKYNLSVERVRQLRNNTVNIIIDLTKNFIQILRSIELKYSNYFNKRLFLFEIEEIKDYFLPENLLFKILSILYDEQVELVINNEKKHEYKYLIPKQISQIFKVFKFINDITLLQNSKIQKSYNLKLKDIIPDYFFTQDERQYSLIRAFVIIFLDRHFGLKVVQDEIQFKRNTKKVLYEYIEEILLNKGEPMHLVDITNSLNIYFKQKPKKIENIRSVCLKYDNIFINTAWSTYGLKKWELNGTQMGGTIKQVVEKILDNYDEPQHIYSIAVQVLKYRNTTLRSIFTNINLDTHNKFKVFEGGFIGLPSKTYRPETTIFNKVSPHWFSFFIRNYLINNRTQLKAHEIYKLLALKFNVKPIQIEALINDRIDSYEISIDEDGYIVSNKIDSVNTESNTKAIKYQLSDDDLEKIKVKLSKHEYLGALQLVMKLIKQQGCSITITEAKKILDNQINEIQDPNT